jgi:hypothetical protein
VTRVPPGQRWLSSTARRACLSGTLSQVVSRDFNNLARPWRKRPRNSELRCLKLAHQSRIALTAPGMHKELVRLLNPLAPSSSRLLFRVHKIFSPPWRYKSSPLASLAPGPAPYPNTERHTTVEHTRRREKLVGETGCTGQRNPPAFRTVPCTRLVIAEVREVFGGAERHHDSGNCSSEYLQPHWSAKRCGRPPSTPSPVSKIPPSNSLASHSRVQPVRIEFGM